eukprot:jgi/Orpsp1_1/1188104/evm.model.d7180000062465.1
MTLPKQNSNTMPSRFKQNKPLLSRQPLNKNELKNEISSINLNKLNVKSENDILKKDLKLCSQIWLKLLKLPLIKYLEKKHNPNVHLDTKVLNEITLVYEKINKEEYSGKDEFYSLVMEIINKFSLICKPTAQVYMEYNNLKLVFNAEWSKYFKIKSNKEFICNICNEEFKLRKDFKAHLKTCNCNSKVITSNTSLSSPPIKYKYEKKDVQKNEKKELSISYKLYSKFFKPEFNMESIKIGDKIECPFNNCNDSSSSLAKLVTHINTNHQDKLTVISDYYCSVCGRKLTDIVSQIIHNIEHQYKKRRKIFSRDCSTTSTTASSLLNPLSSISNSFIPINTSLSLPHSNIKNKSLNSKSSKLKRKYPYDNSSNVISNDASINNLTKNIDKRKENNNYPLTPSPTSSLSQNLHTSPSKINNM